MRRSKKVKLFRIEKLLIRLCVFLVVIFPVAIVLSKAALSNMSLEVEKLKREINAQKNTNESLTMKVNELTAYDKVKDVASNMGLAYNNDSIVIIDDQDD